MKSGVGRRRRRKQALEQSSERSKRDKNRRENTVDWLTAAVGTIFLLTLCVVLVLNLRSIYYYDIGAQHLCEETGLSEETIRQNYDVLIDYNLLTGSDTLEFPDFPMSEHGRIHFEEVKHIFVGIQYTCIVSGILFVLLLCHRFSRRSYVSLKRMALLSLALPSAAGILIAANWEAFFITFHRLVFRNDYWLFDPAADPVILILPDAFFLHCAAAIVLFLLTGSLLAGCTCCFLRRHL